MQSHPVEPAHMAATSEGHLPEEFTIRADNTPAETKNQTVCWFVVWLLCALDRTCLWVIRFLMVGHTHDTLDRFFGRFFAAIAGRDYL